MAEEGIYKNRKYLINMLQTLLPQYKVYNVGQHYVFDEQPYIVLRAADSAQILSTNRLGVYQYYEIMCYVPETSAILLDEMIDIVSQAVGHFCGKGLEQTGIMSGDYHDTEIKMYMRYFEIRVVKDIIGGDGYI